METSHSVKREMGVIAMGKPSKGEKTLKVIFPLDTLQLRQGSSSYICPSPIFNNQVNQHRR